jgi:hypothetical protein
MVCFVSLLFMLRILQIDLVFLDKIRVNFTLPYDGTQIACEVLFGVIFSTEA